MALTETSFAVAGLECACCAQDVRAAVEALPGVHEVGLDFATGRLTVEHDGTLTDEERIRAAVRARGYWPEHERAGASTGQLAHTAQMAPITCGTKCDRMQYELPHTEAHTEHRDPAEHEHDGMGGLDHSMSDPTMAEAMERDMRNRFFVALVLTIPIVLLSPLAVNTFGLELVGSQTARNVADAHPVDSGGLVRRLGLHRRRVHLAAQPRAQHECAGGRSASSPPGSRACF